MNNTNAHNHAAFLLRLSLGVILLAHGLMKIMIFTIPGTVGYFESIGYPAIIAHLTTWGEVLGGAAMIIGFHTRIVALLSLPILLGAAWTHMANGWVFSNQGGGWEFPVLLVMLAVIVTIQGGGSFSVKGLPQVNKRLPKALRA